VSAPPNRVSLGVRGKAGPPVPRYFQTFDVAHPQKSSTAQTTLVPLPASLQRLSIRWSQVDCDRSGENQCASSSAVSHEEIGLTSFCANEIAVNVFDIQLAQLQLRFAIKGQSTAKP